MRQCRSRRRAPATTAGRSRRARPGSPPWPRRRAHGPASRTADAGVARPDGRKPSADRLWRMYPASPSAPCAAGRSIRAAAATSARASRSRAHEGPRTCCVNPVSGALTQVLCSLAGTSSTSSNVATTTSAVKPSVRRATRCSAWTRGGGSSWAACASASPPPTSGRASARPTIQVSAVPNGQRRLDTGEGHDSSPGSGTLPRSALTAAHSTVTLRMPVAIQTARAVVSGPRSNPVLARSHISPISTTASPSARSSARRRPVSRNPPSAVTATADT